jgi:Domain of unknown function (DUF4304)
MPSSDLLFLRLLKELRPLLAEHGFRRRSQNFVIESSGCWGIINFQKSLYSSTGQKTFTINVAIAAKRILRFQGEPTDKPPLHYKSHWEVRLGELIPGCHDRWWTLSDEASYESVMIEVQKLITEKAVPIIKDHLTEGGLLALWGKILGGFEYPRLKEKSILLAERNEFDDLPRIFARIREICHGGSAEEGAERHIAEVEERFHLIPSRVSRHP